MLENPCPSAPEQTGSAAEAAPLLWFSQMIAHCKACAIEARRSGRPVVGIMCEYAPRELIMAAGAVPVCLCGGDADTIASAEQHLPATLCPLIKSTYGYFLDRANPFLEMADLVVAETTCDGKKKMFELMAEARPTYLMALPHKENDPEAMEQWVSELRKFKRFLESRYSVQIEDGKLRSAIILMNRERALRRELAGLMKSDNPPLTGRQLIEFKSIISGQTADLEQYEAALRIWRNGTPGSSDTACACTKARVLLTGVPLVHGAERVIEIIEAHGGLVVCQENCTGLKPILEDVDPDAQDPIRALASKYFHLPCSVKTPNEARLDSLRALAAEYRAECVIELIWQGCLTYLVESLRVRRLAEEGLGLPYLRIETDYSPSDSARIAVRVEALVEMVHNRRENLARIAH
jgi:benzoyl-CoA reductase/2-hydroxyglutaryl-CoA dehydratase subunit BcrC/BadD/HgdB